MTTTDTAPTDTTVEVKSYRRRRPALADQSVTADRARERKQQGQQLSIDDLAAIDEKAFMAAVAAIAPGAKFTANDIRPALDHHGIPNGSRAGLMRTACARGLCAPVMVTEDDGTQSVKKVPSTGRKTNGAYVVQYRRAESRPEGR